jgi:hypothetical protein
MSVCMHYVYMYVCMDVCKYVCTYVCMYLHMSVCTDVRMYYVYMHVLSVYVCIYVCLSIFTGYRNVIIRPWGTDRTAGKQLQSVEVKND